MSVRLLSAEEVTAEVVFGREIAVRSNGPRLKGPKPIITGSRGGNVALASLLTGLAVMGLVTDNSSP